MYRINNAPINGRELVVYGAGHDAVTNILPKLRALEIPVSFCVARDNCGQTLRFGKSGEIEIHSPETLGRDKYFVIVASTNHFATMEDFLRSRGYCKDTDYFVWKIWEVPMNQKLLEYFTRNSPLSPTKLNEVYYPSCRWLMEQFIVDTSPDYYHIMACAITGKNMCSPAPYIDYAENPDNSIDKWLDMRNQLLEQIKYNQSPTIKNFCKGCREICHDVWNHTKFTNFSLSIYPSPCNLRCKYCNYFQKNELFTNDEYLLRAKQIFTRVRERGLLSDEFTIYLCSGEFTANHRKDIIKEIFSDGHILGLTNGVVFDETLAEKLEDGVSCLVISMDAGTRETYKELRGADAFERVCRNIERYTKYGNVRIKYILLKDVNDNELDWNGVVDFLHSINHTELEIATDSVKTINKIHNEDILPALAKFMKKLKSEKINPTQVDFYLSPDDVEILKGHLGDDFQYNWR
jgi:wyosine [tRNA(Phe)-imidazoG37] synthetase (radical SAM superfamily)